VPPPEFVFHETFGADKNSSTDFEYCVVVVFYQTVFSKWFNICTGSVYISWYLSTMPVTLIQHPDILMGSSLIDAGDYIASPTTSEMAPGDQCVGWVFLLVKILSVLFMVILTVLTVIETRRAYSMDSLATSLRSAGWKLYVNMTSCPFCHMQQTFFGPKAFGKLDVIDCDKAENKDACASSACHFASPCWHNSETGAIMIGLQQDRSRLWKAAKTGQ